MFVSAFPDPTCNSEKSANGGNKQILLLLLLLLLTTFRGTGTQGISCGVKRLVYLVKLSVFKCTKKAYTWIFFI